MGEKAISKEQYTRQWKNEVGAILYGPVSDIYEEKHTELNHRMRASITKLCGEIDEVGEILEKQGSFKARG